MSALNTLLSQAEGERNQAMAALRRAEEHVRRLRAQTEQLSGYRADYQRRWAGQFSQQGTMDIVQCYQSFTQRLDEALAQQQQQTTAAEQQVAVLREKLLATELRVASVRKLIERRQAELRHAEDRREQRQTDETAQQVLWRASQATRTESTQY
jgi:flagellar FliJ protein